MTALTSLAKARALETGRAVPIATRRHVQLCDRPLVFVPLSMAGEANAPLACLVGSSASSPRLLVVPQPRNRTLRFSFAASLAEIVLEYVDSFATSMEVIRDRNAFTDAPQLLVANPSVTSFVRLLGRSTRLRRTTGEYAVPESVPLLGRWLTHFAERTEHPGSSAMLAMTSVLTSHWATGQSALEDANLAALMAWIDPPTGTTGPEAALAAEDPLLWPPAGPTTDPSFDNEVLAGLIRSYNAAVSSPLDGAAADGAVARAVAALSSALRSQMEPTWRLIWRAVELLRSLPAGSTLPRRWEVERREFTERMEYWRGGGLPQGRWDQAVAAARRLNALEREQDAYTVESAFDDDLRMAEFRLSGEAFAGTVVWCDPTRVDRSGGGRGKLRPHVRVRTGDPVRLEPGDVVRAVSRPAQQARIIDVLPVGSSVEVTLELSGGMGRSLTPAPGSVPVVGEAFCYTSLARDAGQPVAFPKREETPWTHGGPPVEYVPTNEDAAEVWA